MEERSRYWSAYEKEANPLQYVLEKVPPAEAVGLVRAHYQLASHIEDLNPDIIFFPARGALPSAIMTDAILSEKGKHFNYLQVPLGTATNVMTAGTQGFSHAEKGKIVKQTLRAASHFEGKIQKVLLVDEVQKGGTITQHAKMFRRDIKEMMGIQDLYIIALVDSRHHQPLQERAPGYNPIMRGEVEGIIPWAEILLPMAVLDRQQILDRILIPKKTDGRNVILPHIQHNVDMHHIFTLLVDAYRNPIHFQWAVELLRETPQSLRFSEEIQAVITNYMQKITSVYEKTLQNHTQVEPNKLLDWLSDFTQYSLNFPFSEEK